MSFHTLRKTFLRLFAVLTFLSIKAQESTLAHHTALVPSSHDADESTPTKNKTFVLSSPIKVKNNGENSKIAMERNHGSNHRNLGGKLLLYDLPFFGASAGKGWYFGNDNINPYNRISRFFGLSGAGIVALGVGWKDGGTLGPYGGTNGTPFNFQCLDGFNKVEIRFDSSLNRVNQIRLFCSDGTDSGTIGSTQVGVVQSSSCSCGTVIFNAIIWGDGMQYAPGFQLFCSKPEYDDSANVYMDGNFSGCAASLVEGTHDQTFLKSIGMDNAISDVKVPTGIFAYMFADNLSGSKQLALPNHSFAGQNLTDACSSLTIMKQDSVVWLCSAWPYEGNCVPFVSGDYELWTNEWGLNDAISSIRIPNGYIVTVFEQTFVTGRSMSNVSDINGETKNGKLNLQMKSTLSLSMLLLFLSLMLMMTVLPLFFFVFLNQECDPDIALIIAMTGFQMIKHKLNLILSSHWIHSIPIVLLMMTILKKSKDLFSSSLLWYYLRSNKEMLSQSDQNKQAKSRKRFFCESVLKRKLVPHRLILVLVSFLWLDMIVLSSASLPSRVTAANNRTIIRRAFSGDNDTDVDSYSSSDDLEEGDKNTRLLLPPTNPIHQNQSSFDHKLEKNGNKIEYFQGVDSAIHFQKDIDTKRNLALNAKSVSMGDMTSSVAVLNCPEGDKITQIDSRYGYSLDAFGATCTLGQTTGLVGYPSDSGVTRYKHTCKDGYNRIDAYYGSSSKVFCNVRLFCSDGTSTDALGVYPTCSSSWTPALTYKCDCNAKLTGVGINTGIATYWGNKPTSIFGLKLYCSNPEYDNAVNIYIEPSYGGCAVSLVEGVHDESYLQNVEMNNAISSVKVPTGFFVYMFSDNLSGTKEVALPDNKYAYPNPQSTDYFTASSTMKLVDAVSSATVMKQDSVVWLCSSWHYEGNCVPFVSGDYELWKNEWGLNDAISSIRIPIGYTVTVFEHTFVTGRSISYTSDVYYVGDEWNDQISSIRIRRTEAYGVTVCTDQSYQGKCDVLSSISFATYPYRYYDMNELVGLGLNDAISSIKVPNGYDVIVYEHPLGTPGRSIVYSVCTTDVGPAWTDQISAISVCEGIRIYEGANFQGRWKKLLIGSYDMADLASWNLNDNIASIRIPPCYTVTVYENAGFTGAVRFLTSDAASFESSWKYRISSIQVRIGSPLYGSSFTDGTNKVFHCSDGQPLINLSGRAGEAINQLTGKCGDGATGQLGGYEGGPVTATDCPTGYTGATVRYNTTGYVDQIIFMCGATAGPTIGKYRSDRKEDKFTCSSGTKISGFGGNEGKWTNGINIYDISVVRNFYIYCSVWNNVMLNKDTLITAVNLWINNKPSALTTYGHISTWDVSQITDMSQLFQSKGTFNDNISGWNTAKVTNMSMMFKVSCDASSDFNQPIGSWDTSRVQDMTGMFECAKKFNQPLNSWMTSKVTNMSRLFYTASSFNQPLDSWDTSSVVYMNNMFDVYFGKYESAFNQPIGSWNTANVKDMSFMFYSAKRFNQFLNNWNTSKVTNMACMFASAESFNQPLNLWDVSSVQSMYAMFSKSSTFNQNIDVWKTLKVSSMSYMFENAASFNQPLRSWNIASVNDMTFMFNGATSFGQYLCWNVMGKTTTNMLLGTKSASVDCAPSSKPTKKPSLSPTMKPTKKPTMRPTMKPTKKPSLSPTMKPTLSPTVKTTKSSIIPIVAGSVVVVLIIGAIAGIVLCLKRRKKKPPMTPSAPIANDSNIAPVAPPTIPDPDDPLSDPNFNGPIVKYRHRPHPSVVEAEQVVYATPVYAEVVDKL